MADLTPPPANDHRDDVDILPKESGAKRRKLRDLVLLISLVLTVLGPLVFIFAATGYKLGLLSLSTAFGTLTRELGPLVLATGLVFALLALVLAFLIKPRRGFAIALLGLLLPVLAGIKLIDTRRTFANLPFIHDITTDTQDVPVFGDVVMAERAAVDGVNTADYVGKRAPARGTNGTDSTALVSALQTQAYPEIRPLILDAQRDEVFDAALATAKSMGWEIKTQDSAAGRIDATDTTFWYGFEDDVTIRLRDAKGGGTIVDVRSLSRIGGSDLGQNAERVGEFLERLADAS